MQFMAIKKTTLLLMTFVGLALKCANADTIPELVNYQGTLTDASGNILPNGLYSISFRIYESVDATAPVWGPQSFDGTSGAGKGPQVSVVNGSFNVVLGPLDTTGRSLNAALAQTNGVLGITVGTQPEVQPRQAILSVPYAVTSSYAFGAPLGKVTAAGMSTSEWDAPIGGGIQLIPGLRIAAFPVRAGSRLLVTLNTHVRVTGPSGNFGAVGYVYVNVDGQQVRKVSQGYQSTTSGAPDVWMPIDLTRVFGPFAQDRTVTIEALAQSIAAGENRFRINSEETQLIVQEILPSQWVP